LGFVVYDLETTGLLKNFDQIVQFAAIQTDVDLNEISRAEFRCRLLPHILPSPAALEITSATISGLTNPESLSFYEMSCRIAELFSRWTPTVFLGFNSIRFDEEFIRQALFQCLHWPFATNTNGNSRADVLNLCRAASALDSTSIRFLRNSNGRASFRLVDLASANGIAISKSHNAMADAEATLGLCKIVSQRVPDLWSNFLRFSQKAAAAEFLEHEKVFVRYDYFRGEERIDVLAFIGVNDERPNIHYCLDLNQDLEVLQNLADDELLERLKREPWPVRRIKVNTAPLLFSLSDVLPEHLNGFDHAQLNAKAQMIFQNQVLVDRLMRAARKSEFLYEKSPHVERQIYDPPFFSAEDRSRMQLFHSVNWQDRVKIVSEFDDERLRRLGRRLIFYECPELLPEKARKGIERQIAERLLNNSEPLTWLTIPQVIGQLDKLRDENKEEYKAEFLQYRNYLNDLSEKCRQSLRE
jgi:exodeoxyribonuclease-1